MTLEQINRFLYLWTADATQYVLVRFVPGTDLRECLIFDREAKSALLIEDEQLALEVRRRMAEAGVPVVNELPSD